MQLRIEAAGLTDKTATITACGHVFNRVELNKVLRKTGVCPQCTQRIKQPHIWGPCLPCTTPVWRDELQQIKHMLDNVEQSDGNAVKQVKIINNMFEFMLNIPGFLESAASCKLGAALHEKIADLRSDSRAKSLHSIMTDVEDALRGESVRCSLFS